MMNKFIQSFTTLPTYLGKTVETVTEGGKQFAKVGDSMAEVVYATSADLAKLPYSDLAEVRKQRKGFYLLYSCTYFY